MGYGSYDIDLPDGTQYTRGYLINDTCNYPYCGEKIDRGLDYLCYSCTKYFCWKHKSFSEDEYECFAGISGEICVLCIKEEL